jgi:hypothetical protein
MATSTRSSASASTPRGLTSTLATASKRIVWIEIGPDVSRSTVSRSDPGPVPLPILSGADRPAPMALPMPFQTATSMS